VVIVLPQLSGLLAGSIACFALACYIFSHREISGQPKKNSDKLSPEKNGPPEGNSLQPAQR